MLTAERKTLAIISLFGASGLVSASNIEDIPCSVIVAVWELFRRVVPLLFAIFFIYGAAKYVYSAEDPGGRKQGRTIIIHTIIGAIIAGLIGIILSILFTSGTAGNICNGMTI